MRPKQRWTVVTFATTAMAIAMETYCQEHGVPGRLIPVPVAIHAECGMCWRAPIEQRSQLEKVIKDAHLTGTHVYELEL